MRDTRPAMALTLERYQEAFDTLWHRCRANVPALTVGLPTPHELRTGEGPSEVMDRLRRGHHLDEAPSEARTIDVGPVHVGTRFGGVWECAETCPHPDHQEPVDG